MISAKWVGSFILGYSITANPSLRYKKKCVKLFSVNLYIHKCTYKNTVLLNEPQMARIIHSDDIKNPHNLHLTTTGILGMSRLAIMVWSRLCCLLKILHMGHAWRICVLSPLRTACTSTKSDHGPCSSLYSFYRNYRLCVWIMKTMTRLHGCAG